MKRMGLVMLVLALAGGVGAWMWMALRLVSPPPVVPGAVLQRESLEQDISSAKTSTEPAPASPSAAADAVRLEALRCNREALQQLKEGRLEEAVGLLRQALALAPEDVVIQLNLSRALGRWAAQESSLGHHARALELLSEAAQMDSDQGMPAYWTARVLLRTGRRVEAREVLQKALADFPRQAGLLRMSANLAVLEGDFSLAVQQIDAALLLHPEQKELVERAAQLHAEEALFRTFLTDATAHFESLYDPQDEAMVRWIPDLQRDLENAWTDVVGLLGIQPQQRILVMWMDAERFHWRAPDWSSGLYDGRIRIMIEDYPRRKDEIRRTLHHELTHAVLHTVGTPLPTWLQEGMAQIAEGRPLSQAREALSARLPLQIDLADLSADWTSWADSNRLAQAYFYSMALCGWLQEEYGEGVLRNLFQNLRGRSWDEGWARTFGLAFTTVEARHRQLWETL